MRLRALHRWLRKRREKALLLLRLALHRKQGWEWLEPGRVAAVAVAWEVCSALEAEEALAKEEAFGDSEAARVPVVVEAAEAEAEAEAEAAECPILWRPLPT